MQPFPNLIFPPELPISAHADEIAQAMRAHPVIVVCGDTGSGKTTQLPKIALKAGRGTHGLIGCTQPRRIAAIAMARRVAEDFNSAPGGFVGFQHRFESKLSAETVIKFMTDGILLAETRRDRLFRAYDTLIIDEAHERSLNIDFLLGILKRLLPRRPDLRVIISSATLDVKRFSAFFNDAPVISVPGRLYPIEQRWRPPKDDDIDLPRQIADAVDSLATEPRGDILVFLPGERDIREASEVLSGRGLPNTEIIPLLASLPAGEQQRAFRTSSKRRIILSTNVAETSVTLPGIRYVIDSGLVRLSRFNTRTHVQRLQIEPVSQASANQRTGRCGRIAPGVCIRLYAQDDYQKREPFTPPEILRTSLARVILTLMDLNLGDIESFPFIDPPSSSAVREGYRELELLRAIEPMEGETPFRITHLGRELARLPVEPALARMLFAADRERALADALVIVAGLECEDPKRRPLDAQAEADQAHAKFLTPLSDFSAMLNLWNWYREQRTKLSQSALRRSCKQMFLSYPKMRDWIDLHDQLEDLCKKTLGLDVFSKAGGDIGLHKALLSGLLENIGKRDPETNDYLGPRGIHFNIFPGSGLIRFRDSKKNRIPEHRHPERRPRESHQDLTWVMAGEQVETTRLFARTVAAIDPAWIEPIAKAYCKYSYFSPVWDPLRGFTRISEKVTFYGLTLVESRTRDDSRIHPEEARQLLIREGLIAGAFPPPVPKFLAENLARTRALLSEEEKRRCSGELFNPENVFAFYDQRLPSSVTNAPELRDWVKSLPPADAKRLVLTDADLPPAHDLAKEFPDEVTLAGRTFELTYRNAPGQSDDGVTCIVPVADLAAAAAWRSDWLVPGLLEEKMRYLLTALPAKLRRLFLPYDETLARCLSRMNPGAGKPLAEAFADALNDVAGIRVPLEPWREDVLPDHLRMRFVAIDDDGKEVGNGRNIELLLKLFGQAPAANAPARPNAWHRDSITRWDFGDLPPSVNIGSSGWPILNYPALTDAGETVALRLFPDAAKAAAEHEKGVSRLIALALGREGKRLYAEPALPRSAALYLKQQLEENPRDLGREIGTAALRETFTEGRPPIRTAAAFSLRIETGTPLLYTAHAERTRLISAILSAASSLESQLLNIPLVQETIDGLTEQLAWLLFPGFAGSVPMTQLREFPRYLEACRIRIERGKLNPAGDLRKAAEVEPVWRRYVDFLSKNPVPRHDPLKLARYRWMVEEFRVSLFAQELKTQVPISAKRLDTLWAEIETP